MTSAFDLHCHSTASDGALSPPQVVSRAAANGVRHLALTDHDSVAGIASARRAAEALGVRLIAGVEISVTWERRCFHILGLGVDPTNEILCRGLAGLQRIRRERAAAMAENLARHGIEGSLAAVEEMAGGGMITRTHFARFLVAQDYAASVADVFDRYLVRGKPGYVATRWAGLEEALEWIRAAGGVAVLAHPLRYQLTASWLRRFLSAFQSAGGVGLEVVSGNSSPNQIATCADYARRYRLAGSVGSDFHDPAFPWIDLGRLAPLPPGVEPVWNAFNL
ncbi:3',5'-nucleoside bisphosphate phosphatase [Methylomarinovum tepidoasis]|uniref:3',5'-nucleoside bisphosphate phosphatase n=1 Tax=Methylomarinovum tepidoasis TaxID=2840183 RepID=A0AAU9C5B2_9GAMM|nr:PHP domain-containing protein [Methylomarinovum sp. IN45]BCX88354.1 3',5'-nucleoside bisphosphate phosphatase [Methylomarinovum sp. IN45]